MTGFLKFGNLERMEWLPPWEKGGEKKDRVSCGPLMREESRLGCYSGRLGRLKKLAFLQEREDRFSTSGAK